VVLDVLEVVLHQPHQVRLKVEMVYILILRVLGFFGQE